MHISEYLVQVAEEITNKPLPRLSSEKEAIQWRQEKQKQFHKMLGIDAYLQKERTPLNVTRTGTLQREEYKVVKLYFESLPGLYVTGNLYIPNHLEAPAPAIVYLCGHAGKQKVHYQEHPRRFAQLGFVTLVLDTIQWGEVHGVHHGTYSHGMYDWISKGYTPAAVEVWNAIRGIDLLVDLEEVDSKRIGMSGQSGGGSLSWWTACADDRVKVIASSCGTGTIASHVREETIHTHCDCVFPSNPYGWSLLESCALMAPRPVLIVSPDRDKHFQIESVRYVKDRLKSFYEGFGCGDQIELMEFHGRHSYSSESRKAIFSWFLRYLQSEEVGPEDVSDVDEWREDEEDLLIYNGKTPANDESTTVQDWFIPLAQPIKIQSVDEHTIEKTRVVEQLKKESFFAFPQNKLPLDVTVTQQNLEKNKDWVHKFEFQSEKAWRLVGELKGHSDTDRNPSPTAIYLRTPEDGRALESINIVNGLGSTWIKARIDTRGTGRTAWGSCLDWYLRRSSALMGRTIASMRVWDTLRGIDAVRSMSEVDVERIILAGEGEMAIPAMYAALLDGNIAAVILKNPPSTQNIQSCGGQDDRHLEIMNSLRFTDLPQLAGLLWPTKVIFVGDRPDTYRWAEKMHRELGEPGGTWRVTTLADLPKE